MAVADHRPGRDVVGRKLSQGGRRVVGVDEAPGAAQGLVNGAVLPGAFAVLGAHGDAIAGERDGASVDGEAAHAALA